MARVQIRALVRPIVERADPVHERLQNLLELRRLIDLPILLRSKTNARTIRAATLV